MKNKENRFGGKTCYMCSSPATSDEHVPPKCLFPERKDLAEGKDLRKNLFTVPACNEHNTEKSGNDTYLLYVLSATVTSSGTGNNHFLNKVLRSIKYNPSLMFRMIKDEIPIEIKNNDNGLIEKSSAFNLEKERLDTAFDSIGRGIYFHHFQKKWLNIIDSTAHFVRYLTDDNVRFINPFLDQLEEKTYNLFKNLPAYGENTQVFTYQILEGESNIPLVMRLNFYEKSHATLLFKLKDIDY